MIWGLTDAADLDGRANTCALANQAPAENTPAAPSANAPATVLPPTNVQAPKQAAKRVRQKPRAVAREAAPTAPAQAPLSPAAAGRVSLPPKCGAFDQARGNIFTTTGTTSDTIGHDTIQDLPQGDNATVEKVLLQAPGVSQDSAASGSLHVRNDHANVQYRINGILLPDGVTGFGSIFDTSFIGSISLVTGALPAEYGLRTVGLVDITTRSDLFNNSGSVGVYGGSHGTITPSIEYGGTFGGTCPATTTTTPRYLQGAGRLPPIALPVSNTTSPAAIFRTRWASKIRRPLTMRFTISRSRTRALPICPHSLTRPRGSA